MTPAPEQFDEAVRRAAARPEVREGVAFLYADVQSEIDARRPICSVSGRCCRFEEYGHRLFVTTLELATFVHDAAARSDDAARYSDSSPHAGSFGPGFPSGLDEISPPRPHRLLTVPLASDTGGCPFQVDRLCSVHPFRPFGCRMFFCDATATEWQNQAYERFHARLKRLHESLGVPYFYLEWRTALRALGLAHQPDDRGPPTGL